MKRSTAATGFQAFSHWNIWHSVLFFVVFSVLTVSFLSLDTWVLTDVTLPFYTFFDIAGVLCAYTIFFRGDTTLLKQFFGTRYIRFLPIVLLIQCVVLLTRVATANGLADLELLANGINTQTFILLMQNLPEYLLPLTLAPLWEEFIFRGVLFLLLYKRFGFIVAAVLPSLVFAALHIDPQFSNWSTMYVSTVLIIFLESVFKNWLFYKSESITLPLLMHIFSNVLSYVIQVVYFQEGYGSLTL